MNKTYLFLLVTLLCSCSSSKESYKAEVKKSSHIFPTLANFEVKQGFFGFNDIDRLGFDVEYFISVPEYEEGDTLPIVMALHWFGEDEAHLNYARCLALPGLSSLKAIVILPVSEKVPWFAIDKAFFVHDLMTTAIQNLPVDPKRSLVTGYSMGANGTWYMIDKYPTLFTAAIPIAGSYRSEGSITVPVIAIHSDKDEVFDIETTQQNVAEFQSRSPYIEWVKVDRLGHLEACRYLQHMKDAVERISQIYWKD